MADQELTFRITCDPYSFVMRVFYSKWKPFLLTAMDFDTVTRFSEFRNHLPISEKVLTSNLRELEQDGLIIRSVYPEVPPRVEYQLTELGKSVIPILKTMYDWGWHEMKRRGMPIDPVGEMWHGYREPDPVLMNTPYKKIPDLEDYMQEISEEPDTSE